MTVLLYNHDLERKNIKAETLEITVEGDVSRVTKAVIDETHTNPLAIWQQMGSPVYLKADQVAELKKEAKLATESVEILDDNKIVVGAEAESVTILTIELS